MYLILLESSETGHWYVISEHKTIAELQTALSQAAKDFGTERIKVAKTLIISFTVIE